MPPAVLRITNGTGHWRNYFPLRRVFPRFAFIPISPIRAEPSAAKPSFASALPVSDSLFVFALCFAHEAAEHRESDAEADCAALPVPALPGAVKDPDTCGVTEGVTRAGGFGTGAGGVTGGFGTGAGGLIGEEGVSSVQGIMVTVFGLPSSPVSGLTSYVTVMVFFPSRVTCTLPILTTLLTAATATVLVPSTVLVRPFCGSTLYVTEVVSVPFLPPSSLRSP